MPTALVPFDITIVGLDELSALDRHAFSHVVSILDPDYPEPSVLADFSADNRSVLRFDDILRAEAGMQPPDDDDVTEILALGDRLLADGARHVLVHCHAGISRSTATAAIFMAQHNPGSERAAFEAVRRVRPRSWPNSLIVRLADARLGRQGALIAAMQDHHAVVSRTYPDLAAMLSIHGRAHEVLGLA